MIASVNMHITFVVSGYAKFRVLMSACISSNADSCFEPQEKFSSQMFLIDPFVRFPV